MEHEKQKKSLSNEQQDHVDQTNEKVTVECLKM